VLQRLQFVMQITDTTAARNRFVENGSAGHLFNVLPEVSDRQLLRNSDVAIVRRFLADDHPEQSRFAGAVRTDQPYLFTWVKLKRRVHKKDLTTVLLTNMGKRNHELPQASVRHGDHLRIEHFS